MVQGQMAMMKDTLVLTVDDALSKFGEKPAEGRMPHIKPKCGSLMETPCLFPKKLKNNSLMLSSSVGNPEKSRRLISSHEHRGHHIHYSKQRIRMAPPHGHCSSDLRVD